MDVVPSCGKFVRTTDDVLLALVLLFPDWEETATSVTVSKVPGGITNSIYKVDSEFREPVLVRVFGGQDVFSESQRKQENITFFELSKFGVAPTLLGLFANGRVERWLNASPVSLERMRARPTLVGVAMNMANLHSFSPSSAKDTKSSGSTVWKCIENWLCTCSNSSVAALKFDVISVRKELSSLRPFLEQSSRSPVCYCHNDLLAGNILIGCEDETSVHIIDFEYGGSNYRGFDIGNFFCECMGGTDNGIVRHAFYPTATEQRLFCSAYLKSSSKENDVSPEAFSESIEELVNEANRYSLLAHIYWASWAAVQSLTSTIEFPYLMYAQNRMKAYFMFKAQFWPSE